MVFTINGDLECGFLPRVKCKHTFLIRNPIAAFLSFKRAIVVDPEFNEIPFSVSSGIRDTSLIDDYGFFPIKSCYQQLFRLWKDVGKLEGANPIIIDADELTRTPDILLRKYFEAVGFPWKKEYLTWDTGYEITKNWNTSRQRMDSTLETWRIWHQRSMESSRFIPRTKPLPSIEDLTLDLQEYVLAAMPYYEEMYKYRMRACP